MGASLNTDPARKGVTLVEILVVIVIIGILTGLIMGALGPARAKTRRTLIKKEISQLEMALNTYKTEFSETPPTFLNIDIEVERGGDRTLQDDGRNAVMRHIRKAFPRYVPRTTTATDPDGRLAAAVPPITDYDRFAADVWYAYGRTVDPLKFDAASSLLFFLGGLPEAIPPAGGAWIPAGFHTDPTFPFKPGLPRTQPSYQFVLERIVFHESHYSDPTDASSLPVDRYLRYYPQGVEGADGAPFVYFKARRIGGAWQYGSRDGSSPANFLQFYYPHAVVGLELGNYCVPYRDPAPQVRWRNYENFQIICAGLDGHFGNRAPVDYAKAGADKSNYRESKTGRYYFSDYDYDNLTNFSDNMLEDEISQ
ncbi:type II secretion system protein [Planctomycetota bacterium]